MRFSYMDSNQHSDLCDLLQVGSVRLTMPIKADMIDAGIARHLEEDGTQALFHLFRIGTHIRSSGQLVPCQEKTHRRSTSQIAPPEARPIGRGDKGIALLEVAHRDRVTALTLLPCNRQDHRGTAHKWMQGRAQQPDYDAIDPARDGKGRGRRSHSERHATPHFLSQATFHGLRNGFSYV